MRSACCSSFLNDERNNFPPTEEARSGVQNDNKNFSTLHRVWGLCRNLSLSSTHSGHRPAARAREKTCTCRFSDLLQLRRLHCPVPSWRHHPCIESFCPPRQSHDPAGRTCSAVRQAPKEINQQRAQGDLSSDRLQLGPYLSSTVAST